ncbi:hypothetical protein R5R35_008136 [Gryllus longicercus]|uniref:Uncharacterized protein n=1 Tax=Gryllus longicercus TaxID=2509291 RepID=A0AAN9VEH2_9ORTH
MKAIVAVLLVLVAVAAAQTSYDAFFGRAGNFGPQPGSSNGPDSQGPVLFPMSPTSPDTSGVVVGASGYGFVPPGSQGV